LGDRKDIWPRIPRVSLPEQVEEEKDARENRLTQVHLEKNDH